MPASGGAPSRGVVSGNGATVYYCPAHTAILSNAVDVGKVLRGGR